MNGRYWMKVSLIGAMMGTAMHSAVNGFDPGRVAFSLTVSALINVGICRLVFNTWPWEEKNG